MGKHKKHKRHSHEPTGTGGHEMRVVFQLSTESAHRPQTANKHPSQGPPYPKTSSKHLPREASARQGVTYEHPLPHEASARQGVTYEHPLPHEASARQGVTYEHPLPRETSARQEQPLSALPVSIHLNRLKKPEATENVPSLEHKHHKHKKHKKHKKHHHHNVAAPNEQVHTPVHSMVSPLADEVQASLSMGHEQSHKQKHHHKQHKKGHSFELSSGLSKQEGGIQREHSRPQLDIGRAHSRPQLDIGREHSRPQLDIGREHSRPQLDIGREHSRPQLDIGREHSRPQLDIGREHSRPQLDIGREHSRPQLDIEREHSRPQLDIGREHSRPQLDITREHSRPQLDIGSEHSRPQLDIGRQHSRPQLDIGREHSRPQLDITREHSRPQLDIGREHSRPQLDIGREHSRSQLDIGREHSRPQLSIGREHSRPQLDIGREHSRPQLDIGREHSRPKVPAVHIQRPEIAMRQHYVRTDEVHEILPSPPSPSSLPQGHKSHHKKKKKKHKHHHRVAQLERPTDEVTDDLLPSSKRPRIDSSDHRPSHGEKHITSQKQYIVPRLTTDPITAVPRQDPITAVPRQDPITAVPRQGTITAVPRQGTITTTPRQDAITAFPRQDAITAVPRQGTITTTPRQDAITAGPRQDAITTTSQKDATIPTAHMQDVPTIATSRQSAPTHQDASAIATHWQEAATQKLGTVSQATLLPAGHTHLSVPPTHKVPQVKLSKSALKFFLKNLIHQIQRRDPQYVFAEPVTDDIAPGYSNIIKYPMDLTTIAWKIESSQYPSVNEFKDDFVLMCNNAMTYNAPETMYYATAKNLLTAGLKIIAKETSMRPDIRHGKLSAPTRSNTASPLDLPDFLLPPPTSVQLDYTSPYICRLDLNTLRNSGCSAMPSLEPLDVVMGGGGDQSHLTKVCVGIDDEDITPQDEEQPDDLITQVKEAAEEAKENLDANRPDARFCFVNRNQNGKTMLNILNPDSGEIASAQPVDHSAMTRKVQIGSHAGNVLKTELNLLKATPVTYLMYGPFGSFAPTIDSSFATLQKMDSELLLSSYGSELGVSYAHSLQRFVKGTPSFVTEMADAVLNGLTYNRHGKFKEAFRSFQETEISKKQLQKMESSVKKEPASSSPPSGDLIGEPSPSEETGPNAQETTEDQFEGASSQTTSIDARLMQTSELITELHSHQSERLSLPPEKMDDSHFVLPGPSTQETEIASSLTQELTALTSQVQPQDVVSVPMLHRAMGITENLPESRT